MWFLEVLQRKPCCGCNYSLHWYLPLSHITVIAGAQEEPFVLQNL